MVDDGNSGNPMGVLVIDKPAGITSHDVVDRIRRAFGIKKIGHTGTLDPLATGVLVLCVGDATRYSRFITSGRKAYEAGIMLGVSTATDDTEGEIISEYDGDVIDDITVDKAVEVFEKFRGEQEQVPPAFSAKKIKGQAAYSIARKGGVPQLDPVRINVFRAEVLKAELPEMKVFLEVSSGTYIRSIARDLGVKLGCGAHLFSLRRTHASGFDIGQAVELNKLESSAAESRKNTVRKYVLPVDRALEMISLVQLDDEDLLKIRNGRSVMIEKSSLEKSERSSGLGGEVRIYGDRRGFEGLGTVEAVNGDLELKPLRLIPA